MKYQGRALTNKNEVCDEIMRNINSITVGPCHTTSYQIADSDTQWLQTIMHISYCINFYEIL